MSLKINNRPVDRNSFLPLYAQIYEQLIGAIKEGRLKSGDLLPPEQDLAATFKVSRMTCRQAMQLLTSEGYITRSRGSGSKVAAPKIAKNMAHIQGFSAECRASNRMPSSRVLDAQVTEALPKIGRALNLPPGSTVFRIRRLRLADGHPLALEESILPLPRFQGIDSYDFGSASLYDVLTRDYGLQISKADEVIEARLSKPSEARVLEIPSRSAILVIDRTMYDQDNSPFEIASSIFNGAEYRAILSISA